MMTSRFLEISHFNLSTRIDDSFLSRVRCISAGFLCQQVRNSEYRRKNEEKRFAAAIKDVKAMGKEEKDDDKSERDRKLGELLIRAESIKYI